ncbi:hypothetical protein D3C81_1588780 [compost metagenome]
MRCYLHCLGSNSFLLAPVRSLRRGTAGCFSKLHSRLEKGAVPYSYGAGWHWYCLDLSWVHYHRDYLGQHSARKSSNHLDDW